MVRRDGGGEFAIGYEIVELVEPELLVLRSDPMPEIGMHEPTVTRVELHDHGAKTRMTLTDGPYPVGREHAESGWASLSTSWRRWSAATDRRRARARRRRLAAVGERVAAAACPCACRCSPASSPLRPPRPRRPRPTRS